MPEANQENLKTIYFNGEMLPKWAQLLDLAARIGPVPVEVRNDCGSLWAQILPA